MVVINPAAVQRPAAPPVVIETVTVGEETRRANGRLVLAAGERDIDIVYTAPTFVRPEDVRFQYKLDGYDDAWRDVGDRRVATYTNLAPGQYTFRVKAGRGGSWSEEGASLTLERRPFFWETTWFYGLGALLLAFAGPSIYVYRVRQLKARQEALERTVTERTVQIQQQAEELRRANELKSHFLANISHEFRTPLTLTFGPLNDLLSGRYQVEAKAYPLLERAHRNGKRLLRLINQLLDLSKFDAGALTLQPQQQDLVAFLRQRIAAFESLAADRGLSLAFVPDTATLSFCFDAEKLETVLLNLLSNAFKFTPEGSTILVAVRSDDAGNACLTVRDNGIGIASAHLPHLFDRFYQADSSTTRAREGTGIGLALVKQFVTLHGGEITVESEVGVGTTFTITLPVRLPEAVSAGGNGATPDDVRSLAVPAAVTPPLAAMSST